MVTDKGSFILKAIEVHKGLYSYDNFIYNSSVEKSFITCKIHGDFLQNANKHLAGRGCPKCKVKKIVEKNRESYFKSIPDKVRKYHGDKYNINDTNFKKAKDYIEITCPIHGKFNILQDSFLRGKGCQKCSRIQLSKNATGFTNEFFLKKYREKRGIPKLYILLMYDEEESFIKIGITYDLSKRYTKSNLPYNYKTLFLLDFDPELILPLEKIIKKGITKHFKQYRYKPKKYFGGHTECYKIKLIDLMVKSALNLIKNE